MFCLDCGKEIGKKEKCPYCGFDWTKDLCDNGFDLHLPKRSRHGLKDRISEPLFTDEEALILGIYPDKLHKAILLDKIREKRKRK